MTVHVHVGPVSFEDIVAVAREGATVELGADALAAIDEARAVVDALAAAGFPVTEG